MDLGLRLTVAASMALSPLVPLGARLAYLQVLRHDNLSTRASGEFSRTAQEAAPRADLLDRQGRVLARSNPSWSCFVDKAMVKDAGAFGAKLAPLLQLPAAEIARKTRAATRFARFLAYAPRRPRRGRRPSAAPMGAPASRGALAQLRATLWISAFD